MPAKEAYLIRGPFIGKGNRAFCIACIDGKRRKINYSKFVLLKEGIDVGDFDEIHHRDGNRQNDTVENLEVLKPHIHKKADEKLRRQKHEQKEKVRRRAVR